MMKSIHIFIPLDKIPSGTAQERKYAYNPKLRRVMSYPSKACKDAKAIYRKAFKEYVPKEPLKAPIQIEVNLLYPTKDKRLINTYKTTRPDGDNLLKVIKDVMNELDFFEDDAHISVESIERRWVEFGKGGIEVLLWEV